jgi:hypothetical protein
LRSRERATIDKNLCTKQPERGHHGREAKTLRAQKRNPIHRELLAKRRRPWCVVIEFY